MPIIGALIGKSPEEVFSAVSELKRRDLLQVRGPWRAVLPHSIANRLAAMGLQNIAPAKLRAGLVESAPARLLRSFSRRLGYLDGSKEACVIVQGWLMPGGLLADVVNLHELGRAMFSNVGPVMPDAVLSTLESAFAGADAATLRKCTHFVRLLRSLAYDAAYFERALSLLVKFACLSSRDESDNDATSTVEASFASSGQAPTYPSKCA